MTGDNTHTHFPRLFTPECRVILTKAGIPERYCKAKMFPLRKAVQIQRGLRLPGMTMLRGRGGDTCLAYFWALRIKG